MVELNVLIVLTYQQFETALSHQGEGNEGEDYVVFLVGQLPQAIVVAIFCSSCTELPSSGCRLRLHNIHDMLASVAAMRQWALNARVI